MFLVLNIYTISSIIYTFETNIFFVFYQMYILAFREQMQFSFFIETYVNPRVKKVGAIKICSLDLVLKLSPLEVNNFGFFLAYLNTL